MQLILLIGNYMNGTGVKGGAFGFRVSSINKVPLELFFLRAKMPMVALACRYQVRE
jgi:hypothetical protein